MSSNFITIDLPNTMNCSENFVKQQINMKNSHQPYLANTNMVNHSITDMNTFPYTRFYRGNFNSNPTIFDREAGYHQRSPTISNNVRVYNSLAELQKDIKDHIPNVCFKSSAKTQYRCIPTEDDEANNKIINAQIIHNNSV